MKRCTKCDDFKSLELFPANKHTRDGKGSWCKACVSVNTAAYLKTDRGRAALARGAKRLQAAGYWRFGKGAIANIRNGAAKRGLTFKLTEDTLEAWWRDTPDVCVYCGISTEEFIRLRDWVLTYASDDYEITKFRRVFKSPKHAASNWLSLDRLDNSRGYEYNNLVKSCWFCNSIKGSLLTHEDMLKIAPEIIKRLRRHIIAVFEKRTAANRGVE